MSANQNNNHRPAEARPPQPKKRKTAALAPFQLDEPSNSNVLPDIRVHRYKQAQSPIRDNSVTEQTAFRVPQTPLRKTVGPLRPHIAETPVRPAATTSLDQSNRGQPQPVMGSAPRMLATAALPQARIVQEQAGRLSPMQLGLLASKSAPKPRNQRQSTVMNAMSARNTPMSARSVSKAPEKVAASFPAVALELPDSEDSSDENFTISKPIIVLKGSRPAPFQRAARKMHLQLARKRVTRNESQRSQDNRVSLIESNLFDDRDDESENDLYVDADPGEILHRAHRFRDGQSNSEVESEKPEDLEKQLTDMLNALSIREVRLQALGRLPFLPRNLRKSLDALEQSRHREQDEGLNDVRSTDITKVNVVYIMGDYESSGGSFSGRWFCPLCAIEMWFNIRGALDTHIRSYHTDCDYEWANAEDDQDSLLLRINIPEVPMSDTESEGEDYEDNSAFEEGSPSDDEIAISTLNHSFPEDEKPFLRGSSVVRAQTQYSSSPVKVQPVSPQLSPLRPGVEAPTPTEVRRPARPIDPEVPKRYPTPPPLDDLEGPAAVYPYISEDRYSARPGGPKLYDILNELSLEPFGIMTWYIIDREEDIFELDNMRDEDKVMLALWGRWIFLNRMKFIQNYAEGIKAFIDEYWCMIHRAAGFAALRTWLLVLVQNRFLTGTQFCDALKYYIDLVGMDLWK